MEENIKTDRTEMIAYLQIIEGAIDRMGSNSAVLKGFSAAVLAGISALASIADVSVVIIALTLLPIALFGYLDAKYLQVEKKFRILYEQVRTGAKDIDFSMKTVFSTTELKKNKATLFDTMRSWSVWPFYGVSVVIGFVMVFLKCKGCI